MSRTTGPGEATFPDSKQKGGRKFLFSVSPVDAGARLDLFLVRHFPDFSRSALAQRIREGSVRVDGNNAKTGYRVRLGERVEVLIPPLEPSHIVPEYIDFQVLFEDNFLLVLAKPPGLVVHPAPGHHSGTLVHALLYHCQSLPAIDEQRPGIVHRLDKDTSGIMLVAKTDKALQQLAADFQGRKIDKTYHALLLRCPSDREGRLVKPIGRHPVNRKKMAVRERSGRYAATRWRVLERFNNGLCFVEFGLETGRTHQIRVHMASLGCPVAGDMLYGGRVSDSTGLNIPRQFLHASSIRFSHPEDGRMLTFTAPLWPDMQSVLDQLRIKNSTQPQKACSPL